MLNTIDDTEVQTISLLVEFHIDESNVSDESSFGLSFMQPIVDMAHNDK